MPSHPGKSTASSFLEGLSAGFARQNISGAIREGRAIDEKRFKQQQFDDDVQKFQFSIGDSPSAKKSFEAMAKRSPGWERDPKVFREFVSNYHTLNDVTKGIDSAVQSGVVPESLANLLKKQAIDDPEGTGKLLVMQSFNHQAGLEKSQVAEKKQKIESFVKSQALILSQTPDRNAGLAKLVEQGIPTDVISDIVKSSETFKGAPDAADFELDAANLFNAQRLNEPEDIQSAANQIADPTERAAFVKEATKNMLSSQQMASIAEEAQIEQEQLKDVTDAMFEDGITSQSTDAEIRTFMKEDEFKDLKLNPAKMRIAMRVADRVRAGERKQKIARKSESSKELVNLKGSGLDTSKYSADSVANNYVRFDPKKFQQTRVFETDENIKSSGVVRTPGVGSGAMTVTNFADGSFAGADIPNLNGKPTYYQMELDGSGNLNPVIGPDGQPVVIPVEAAKESIRTMLFDTTPEGSNPIKMVQDLLKDLSSKIKNRDDVTKTLDSGKTVPNPDTPHGLMFMQLKSTLDSLVTERKVEKKGALRFAVGSPTTQALRNEGEAENFESATDAYLKYQELRNKLINTESGFYNRKAQ